MFGVGIGNTSRRVRQRARSRQPATLHDLYIEDALGGRVVVKQVTKRTDGPETSILGCYEANTTWPIAERFVRDIEAKLRSLGRVVHVHDERRCAQTNASAVKEMPRGRTAQGR